MKFLPKLGISVVNALFPALTLKITNIENWDSSSFIIKIQIIRLYLAKVLNVILYAGLNLELATDNAWFGSSSSRIPFDSSTYNCREDQAGLGLIILVFSEFVTSKVIPLLTVFFYWILAKCKKSSTWKKEIKVSQQVINLIYFQGLLWITVPFFPYVVLIAPILLFIDFKFQAWKLSKLQIKPLDQTQSSEIMILIMRLFNITLVLVLFYFGYFLTVEISHGTDQITCGPFPNLTSADSLIISDIKSTAVLKQLWENVINYSPFFWILLLFSIFCCQFCCLIVFWVFWFRLCWTLRRVLITFILQARGSALCLIWKILNTFCVPLEELFLLGYWLLFWGLISRLFWYLYIFKYFYVIFIRSAL